MDGPKWLKKYYGKEFDSLHPIIIMEGDKVAVVRLIRTPTSRVHSSIGYVLIKKGGSHNSSEVKPLHEGPPSAEAMQKMKKAFDEAEAK